MSMRASVKTNNSEPSRETNIIIDGLDGEDSRSASKLLDLSPRLSTMNIDVDMINQSLAFVNPFSSHIAPNVSSGQLTSTRRRSIAEKHPNTNQSILVLKITADESTTDDSNYLDLTLRELLNIVLASADAFDEKLIKSDTTLTNSPGIEPSRHHSVKPVITPINRQSTSVSLPKSSSVDNLNVLVGDKLTHGVTQIPVLTPDTPNGAVVFNAVNILRLRDLRRLDFLFNPVDEANLIVRRHVVLVSFDPIRALIMADKLLLIVPDGADSLLEILRKYMTGWKERHQNGLDSSHDIPFEAHAYEALFTTVTAVQTQEYNALKKDVDELLSWFQYGAILPIEKQEKMRSAKNAVNLMKSRINGHKRVLLELMDDDEVMALMNLSKLRKNPTLYQSPLAPEILAKHEDIEELLETYLMDYNSIESKLENLRVQIQSAEELVSLRLDTSRNELLVANTYMAVLACCIGFASYIAGIFGMNLDNVYRIQPVPGIFFTVFSVTMVLIFVSFFSIILYYTETGVLPKRVNARPKKSYKSNW